MYKQLRWWQRANHFPGRHILGHKDKIATLFSKVRARYPRKASDTLDFMPESYVLRGSLQADTKLCAVRRVRANAHSMMTNYLTALRARMQVLEKKW